MIFKLRMALAIHAVLGAVLVCYSMWSIWGNDPSKPPGFHRVAALLLLFLWVLEWRVVVRKWPIPDHSDQPLNRFNRIPPGLVLLSQGCLLALFAVPFPHSWDEDLRWLLVGDFVLVVALIVGGLSWLAAGVRFQLRTWILSCAWAVVGFVGIALLVGYRWANAG